MSLPLSLSALKDALGDHFKLTTKEVDILYRLIDAVVKDESDAIFSQEAYTFEASDILIKEIYTVIYHTLQILEKISLSASEEKKAEPSIVPQEKKQFFAAFCLALKNHYSAAIKYNGAIQKRFALPNTPHDNITQWEDNLMSDINGEIPPPPEFDRKFLELYTGIDHAALYRDFQKARDKLLAEEPTLNSNDDYYAFLSSQSINETHQKFLCLLLKDYSSSEKHKELEDSDPTDPESNFERFISIFHEALHRASPNSIFVSLTSAKSSINKLARMVLDKIKQSKPAFNEPNKPLEERENNYNDFCRAIIIRASKYKNQLAREIEEIENEKEKENSHQHSILSHKKFLVEQIIEMARDTNDTPEQRIEKIKQFADMPEIKSSFAIVRGGFFAWLANLLGLHQTRGQQFTSIFNRCYKTYKDNPNPVIPERSWDQETPKPKKPPTPSRMPAALVRVYR